MIDNDVLALLVKQEYWDRFGSQFDKTFWESEIHQKIFELIKSYWDQDPIGVETIESTVFEKLVLSHIIGQAEQNNILRVIHRILEIRVEEVEPLVRDALMMWKARDIIKNAAEDIDRRQLDPEAVAAQFEMLARAVDKDWQDEVSPDDDIENIFSRDGNRLTYPTGIMLIDGELQGGLWAKELGLLLAPTYVGKTYALVHLACCALRAGIPVQHFTTEISRERVITRFCQNLLGMDRMDVIRNPSEVGPRLRAMNLPHWSVKDYSNTGVRTAKIRHEVLKFTDKCGRPPLILVDHLDLESIKPNNSKLLERFALTAAAEELRQISAEAGCGVWTAMQANRPAFGSGGAHVRMEHAAESLGPVRKADVIITLNQNEEERETECMRWYIAKARERIVTIPAAPVKSVRKFQRFEDV